MWLVWLACIVPPLIAAGCAPLFALPAAVWLGAGFALPVGVLAAWLEQRGIGGEPIQALQGMVIAMLLRMFALLILFVVVWKVLPEWKVTTLLTAAACLVVALVAGAMRLSRLAESAPRRDDAV